MTQPTASINCPPSETATARSTMVADLSAIKARQRRIWSAGDYSVIGNTLQIVAEQLCEAVDLRGGERVLDIASGTGNAALAAARRWAHATSSDLVPSLVEHARRRAAADNFSIATQEADAEALPFADASFDVVLSVFGVMFTGDHESAAGEALRVSRPSGRIGLANWTPDGFVGQMLATVRRHVQPPAGAKSPTRWGTEEGLRDLFRDGLDSLTITRREYMFRYQSPEHWLEIFRRFYGPVHLAFAALEPAQQTALAAELLALARAHNAATDGTLVVPASYLEVVAVRG